MTTLGNRLRELREAAGMTQYELARTLATGQNRISDHEVSAHIPTLPMLRRYADAHGTTVSNLLAGVM